LMMMVMMMMTRGWMVWAGLRALPLWAVSEGCCAAGEQIARRDGGFWAWCFRMVWLERCYC
jgi:hypothetical protein